MAVTVGAMGDGVTVGATGDGDGASAGGGGGGATAAGVGVATGATTGGVTATPIGTAGGDSPRSRRISVKMWNRVRESEPPVRMDVVSPVSATTERKSRIGDVGVRLSTRRRASGYERSGGVAVCGGGGAEGIGGDEMDG